MWQFMEPADIETMRGLKDAMAQHESSAEYKKLLTRALNIPGCKPASSASKHHWDHSDTDSLELCRTTAASSTSCRARVPTGLHVPEKEATVNNILQTIRSSSSRARQFVSDYSGQQHFLSRSGSDGLHVPEKEATVNNILQTIRSCNRSLEAEDSDDMSSHSPTSRNNSFRERSYYPLDMSSHSPTSRNNSFRERSYY
ncbi:hypothetical protein CRUP_002731, partial [Coryphaenoides rupestris]